MIIKMMTEVSVNASVKTNGLTNMSVFNNKTDFIGSAKFGLLYKDKKDKVFGLDLGVINANNNVTPYIGGSMYWKLSFKKKKYIFLYQK